MTEDGDIKPLKRSVEESKQGGLVGSLPLQLLHGGAPGFHALPVSRRPQLTHDIGCGLAGFIAAIRWKGDGAYPCVPASTIALAHLGQIDHVLFVRPGVGTYRHFYAKAAATQPHTIDCV